MNILLDIYLEKNLGDDLFLESILKRYPTHNFYIFTRLDYSDFEKRNPNLKIVKLNRYLNYALSRLNKMSYYKKKFIKNNQIDMLVAIGGSIFIEFEGWEKLYKERLSLWKYMQIEAKKVFVLGSNFGPYRSEAFFEKYDEAFKFVDDLCFRDQYSYDLFKYHKQVRKEADVITSYPIESYLSQERENAVGISVINLSDRQQLAQYQDEYIKKMVTFINHYTLKGKKVYLISFCQHEGDEEISELILAQVKERKDQVEKLYYRGDIEDFLKRFAKIKQIIACRFHSIILSLLFDKEFYSLIYSQKSSNFITDSKLHNPMSNIEEIGSLTPIFLEESIKKAENKKQLVISGEKQYLNLDYILLS